MNAAKKAKKDEFYTQLSDIENELRHYKEHFRGKTVLCNCDDPRISMFFHYFAYQFEALGLKRLTAPSERGLSAKPTGGVLRAAPAVGNPVNPV